MKQKTDSGLKRFKMRQEMGEIEIKMGGRSHPYIMGGVDSVPFCVLSIPIHLINDSFLSNHIKNCVV